MNKNSKEYLMVVKAKEILSSELALNEYNEDALRSAAKYAWNIRHTNYALFRAIMSVTYAGMSWEDLRWGIVFNMPTTHDTIDWMKKFSRREARELEQYKKERGI